MKKGRKKGDFNGSNALKLLIFKVFMADFKPKYLVAMITERQMGDLAWISFGYTKKEKKKDILSEILNKIWDQARTACIITGSVVTEKWC